MRQTVATTLVSAALTASALLLAPNARAYWTTDGTPVASVAGAQSNPRSVSDGAGGSITVWLDPRNGPTQLYAQRLSRYGDVVAPWPVNGVQVTAQAVDPRQFGVAGDGVGGAIIVWAQSAGKDNDLYAQRISATGQPMWGPSGAPASRATGNQQFPVIVADGSGGAYIAFEDGRNSTRTDIYCQRLDANGIVGSGWSADGNAVCTATREQYAPTITAIGWPYSTAIIAWADRRSGEDDIYAQSLGIGGKTYWTANGLTLVSGPGAQQAPSIAGATNGGAYVTWQDTRRGTAYCDIYAIYLSSSGTFGSWNADRGTLISAVSGSKQLAPQVVVNGAVEPTFIWYRSNGTTGQVDLYAQRRNTNATVYPGWAATGNAVCTAVGSKQDLAVLSDGAGGFLASWADNRSGNYDIYAIKFTGSAALGTGWTANGTALCRATGNQYHPSLVTDGAGGANVAWDDARVPANVDIYAQGVTTDGLIGPLQPITVTSPNGGESWAPGSMQSVSWVGSGTVRVDLTADGGVSWTTMVPSTSSPPAAITVPATWTSTLVKARVVRTSPASSDQSDGFVRVVPSPGHAWGAYSIDGTPVRGEYASAAPGPFGVLGVSYYDRTNGDLRFVHQSGAGWTSEAVESAGNVGLATNLIYDAQGYPRIVYLESDSRLRYARQDASGWHILPFGVINNGGPIDPCAIAIDASGAEHILAHVWGSLSGFDELIYLRHDLEFGDWVSMSLQSEGYRGAWVSMRLNSQGLPVISCASVNPSIFNKLILITATLAPTRWEWHDEVVASNASSNSLLLDADGNPWISFHTLDGLLCLASKVGGAWQIDTVDASGGKVGHYNSLGMTPGGEPRISYAANGLLKYASRNGSTWTTEVVDASGNCGQFSSLTINAFGNPRIAYHDTLSGLLKFAVLPSDAQAPAAVTDLTGAAGRTTAALAWTAPGDDGAQGTAYLYELRRSNQVIDETNFRYATLVTSPSPSEGGTPECREFSGLSPCQPYWYALRTYDDAGYASPLSNVLFLQQSCASGGHEVLCPDGARAALPAVAALEAKDIPAHMELSQPHPSPARDHSQFRFGVPAAETGQRFDVSLFDVLGRRVRTLAGGRAEPGYFVVRWDLRSDAGDAVPSGLYFLRFRLGGRQMMQRVMTVR